MTSLSVVSDEQTNGEFFLHLIEDTLQVEQTQIEQYLPLVGGDSITLPLHIFARASDVHATVQFEYGTAQVGGFKRVFPLEVCLAVSRGLHLQKISICHGGQDEQAGCTFMIDLFNPTARAFDVASRWTLASTSTCNALSQRCIQPQSAVRMLLPVECFELTDEEMDEIEKAQPNRQHVKAHYQLSDSQRREKKLEFCYKAAIIEWLELTWRTGASSHGKVFGVHNMPLALETVCLLRPPALCLDAQLLVNRQDAQPIVATGTCVTLSQGDFHTILVRVTQSMGVATQPVIVSIDPLRNALQHMCWVGTFEDSVTLKSGVTFEKRLDVCFFAQGTFHLSICAKAPLAGRYQSIFCPFGVLKVVVE